MDPPFATTNLVATVYRGTRQRGDGNASWSNAGECPQLFHRPGLFHRLKAQMQCPIRYIMSTYDRDESF
jgi:hypothetical protein